MISVEHAEDLRAHVGSEARSAQSVLIDAALIDAFIAVSQDDQPIHRGPDAIAPGNLLLSLAPRLLQSAIEVRSFNDAMTARIDKVVFRRPVRVGERLTLSAKILRVGRMPGGRTAVATECRLITNSDAATFRAIDVYTRLD